MIKNLINLTKTIVISALMMPLAANAAPLGPLEDLQEAFLACQESPDWLGYSSLEACGAAIYKKMRSGGRSSTSDGSKPPYDGGGGGCTGSRIHTTLCPDGDRSSPRPR